MPDSYTERIYHVPMKYYNVQSVTNCHDGYFVINYGNNEGSTIKADYSNNRNYGLFGGPCIYCGRDVYLDTNKAGVTWYANDDDYDKSTASWSLCDNSSSRSVIAIRILDGFGDYYKSYLGRIDGIRIHTWSSGSLKGPLMIVDDQYEKDYTFAYTSGSWRYSIIDLPKHLYIVNQMPNYSAYMVSVQSAIIDFSKIIYPLKKKDYI